MTFLEAARMTEDEARTYIESVRWPNGPICPHCGCANPIWAVKSASARLGVYTCGSCDKQFTVTVGTVMERSHILLNKWVAAFYAVCSHKKSISALQLQRDLGLGSYRTAWFLAHRIRHAMKQEPLASLLKGTVEVDETYIGGKSREGIPGRGSERKTPVVALVERNGSMVSHPVERVDAASLKGAIRENVDRSATIMTDEWSAYAGLHREFAGHSVVRHSMREYDRGGIHTNAAESYFALLKRGVHGTYHHVSKRHLGRYCDEYAFRWNRRRITDGARTADAIRAAEGKRLLYREPKA